MDGPEKPTLSPKEAAREKGKQVYYKYLEQGQHLLVSDEDLDPLKEGIEGKLAGLIEEAWSLTMELDPANPNPPSKGSNERYVVVLNELRGIGEAAREDGNLTVFNTVDNAVHWD